MLDTGKQSVCNPHPAYTDFPPCFYNSSLAFTYPLSHHRLAESASQNRAIGGDPLDVNVMKFICKEFWIEIFKKQVGALCSSPRACDSCRGCLTTRAITSAATMSSYNFQNVKTF